MVRLFFLLLLVEKNSGRISIKNWSVEDRPREKLMERGRKALTDAELLAILLGSGTQNLNALDIAKNILREVGNNIDTLAAMNISELKKFKGIGDAKAIVIISSLELARRRKSVKKSNFVIRSSGDVALYMNKDLIDLKHEEFWVMFLDRKNAVIKSSMISSGGLSGTVVDPRIIFKEGIELYSSGIILIHNHPSGNCVPSNADKQLTQRMKTNGEMMEIRVLDHVIFSNNGYFSFSDEGLM